MAYQRRWRPDFLWFMELLVIVFGFLNYALSDDLVGARATFGITYRELFFICFNNTDI
jgi:hypothetical protein